MNVAVGIIALLLASPVVVIAAVLWWKFSLAVAVAVLGLQLAGLFFRPKNPPRRADKSAG